MFYKCLTLQYTIVMEPAAMDNKSFIVHNVPKHQHSAAVKIIKSSIIAKRAEAWRIAHPSVQPRQITKIPEEEVLSTRKNH